MKIVNESFEILSNISENEILKFIEFAGRTCYKSEEKITDESAIAFCKNLIKRQHYAMLEHASISVKFIIDRGVSHEIVRHRIASYAQESTRYCNYSKDKFGNEITVINLKEHFKNPLSFDVWYDACLYAEKAYFKLLELGESPQIARSILPTCTKTEIVCTFNVREWFHFFNLRAIGTTGAPHPQMTEITIPLLKEFAKLFPVLFEDLKEKIK